MIAESMLRDRVVGRGGGALLKDPGTKAIRPLIFSVADVGVN